jgi:hypothetical protein
MNPPTAEIRHCMRCGVDVTPLVYVPADALDALQRERDTLKVTEGHQFQKRIEAEMRADRAERERDDLRAKLAEPLEVLEARIAQAISEIRQLRPSFAASLLERAQGDLLQVQRLATKMGQGAE